MTKNKLNKILDDHKKWLEAEGGTRANLIRADLRGADLSGASLRGADLSDADLRDADLSGAGLSGADLRRADLRGADLRRADLSGADLSGAGLRGAGLRGADLSGADLRGADLDYSCMPLWCGDLKADYDEKQMIQQLYHVLSHVKYSDNSTDRLKEILLKDELVALANEFHRAEECGEITK